MKDIDVLKLSGKELYAYFTRDNSDYSNVISLLPYAVMDDESKVYELLERSVRENKKFYAHYPAFPKLNKGIDISKMEEIGGITDGALYLG
ncbi:MAG: hypothetical protein LBE04_02605 [Prevotellaceae bacterium]|jgi:hypothetical protein|nr:hypothetical protein [Prevotellaceae bacterium]